MTGMSSAHSALLFRILSPALQALQNVHSTHASLMRVPCASSCLCLGKFIFSQRLNRTPLQISGAPSPTALLNFTHLSSPHLQRVPPQLRDLMCSIWAPSAMLWGFSGSSVVKNLPANTGDAGDPGSIPESGRSLGVGNGN